MVRTPMLAKEPLIWEVFLVLAAETALPGCAGRLSAVWKPQMHVFGVESPLFQPPQGRSGRFRTHFSPVMTGAAGQSSGSRSPEAAQAAARSSPDLDVEPCHGRTPARDPERMLHPHLGLRRLRLGRGAARRQRPAPAGVHGNLPRHLAMRVRRTLPDPAISGVSSDLFLLAVQKPVRRRQVPPSGAPAPGGRCRCAASSRNAAGCPSSSGASSDRWRYSPSRSTTVPK